MKKRKKEKEKRKKEKRKKEKKRAREKKKKEKKKKKEREKKRKRKKERKTEKKRKKCLTQHYLTQIFLREKSKLTTPGVGGVFVICLEAVSRLCVGVADQED